MIALMLVIIINSLIISLSPNPITLNSNNHVRKYIRDLAPQGWAFFTKDVDKGFYILYKFQNNKIEKFKLSTSDQDQFFGLKRNNRLIFNNVLQIINSIDSNLWFNSNETIDHSLLQKLSKVSIKSHDPIIYGQFLVAKGSPIPYEWYNTSINFMPKMDYIILEIKEE